MASARKRGKPPAGRVVLDTALVIGGAAQLHAKLRAALASSAPVVLDAAAVAQIDTAGMQLLHAFVQARNAGAGQWCWENVSDALRDGAVQLGMEQMLDLPAVAPAAA